MKQSITKTFPLFAIASALSLLVAGTSHAVFTALPSPTPEFPGASLGAVQATGGGRRGGRHARYRVCGQRDAHAVCDRHIAQLCRGSWRRPPGFLLSTRQH